MKKILIANWKMNPETEIKAVKLARAIDANNVIIVPPFPFLKSVGDVLKKSLLGAQDIFYKESGAYTGEVSPTMIKKLGVKYVIIGHSERRALGESDKVIARKVDAALDIGLNVVLCVGEPLSIYKKGEIRVHKFIKKQLSLIRKRRGITIAYEPIWAIGTGKNANPEYAARIARFIKSTVSAPVLYGGSTNSKNTKEFLEKKEFAGLLVGGASLDIKEFRKMIKIVINKR